MPIKPKQAGCDNINIKISLVLMKTFKYSSEQPTLLQQENPFVPAFIAFGRILTGN